MTSLRERDPFDVRLARTAPAPLGAFNDAGVLSSADVQVARRLAALGDVGDAPAVLLALALAVRAPRFGHVLVDLATIRTTVAVDTEEPVDLAALPWPADADAWVAEVAACALVAVGEDDDPPGDARPLRLVGARLYLDRYWREERQVAADLRSRAGAVVEGVDDEAVDATLARLFPDPADEQARRAARTAAARRLAVIAGGPGTGKTTAVARILALLAERAGGAPPLLALAAPTGKAAVRLGDAVHEEAERLDVPDAVRAQLRASAPKTLHGLLGLRPGSRSRFAHHRDARLPHDVVVVDETSMVSLSQMSRLLEAVRPDARLILVGDPDQLSSIEAGAVLGDVVAAADGALAGGVVVLDRLHRYRGGIAHVAEAVRRGDPDAVVAALRAGDNVVWVEDDAAAVRADARIAPVRDVATRVGREVIARARAGDGAAALAAQRRFGLLCAHRRGPYGVSGWGPTVEAWLAAEIEAAGGRSRDYPGRPLLVTANQRDLNLANGDLGVIVEEADGRLAAVFERSRVRPNQLGAVETVYAMTVHKSQGSQFGTAAMILPPPTSRILTRELLYTGVTRARDQLVVVGTEDAVRAAVARPAARASGLAARLAPPSPR